MLRLLAGLAIGIYMGFQAPKYAPRLLEVCHQLLETHQQSHEEEAR
jgi:hypothetical protein